MTKKNEKLNVRDLVNKFQENCEQINTIADACEKEQRDRNEKENATFEALTRENMYLQIRMQAAAAEKFAGDVRIDTDSVLRENLLSRNAKVTLPLMREITPQTTEALADTGIIPISEQDILKPIRTGLIWDKVGINIRTGLVGTLRWPKHTKAVAQWAGEAEKLIDAKIEFDKLTMNGTRLGIAIPVTREELENSQGIVENVIKTEAPAAVIDKINEAMFATTTDGGRKVYGPLVKAYTNATEFAAAVPTRKELLKMRTKVSKAIGTISNGAWVMTEDMKAELEDVKVDAGSGRFVCENDKILGFPVFVTDAIGQGNIAFGDWSYQAAGFFGQANFIADPYTLARQNSVDFVLNTHFGTVTLREEAFVLCKAKG